MEKLYVLYDAECGLCTCARRWLMRQPALINLSFIPAGSALAQRLFPGLSRPGELPEELVVVSDEGGVYRDGSAWIMCLFALDEYRDWANRLSHPLLRPLARRAFALLSRERSRISRWLSLASDIELAETLRQVNAPACSPRTDAEGAERTASATTIPVETTSTPDSLANHEATHSAAP